MPRGKTTIVAIALVSLVATLIAISVTYMRSELRRVQMMGEARQRIL